METTQCPQGVTHDELVTLLGDRLDEFSRWMAGQTMSYCNGKTYAHNRSHGESCGHAEGEPFTWKCDYPGGGHYEDTVCAGNPHGPVVYRSDLDRFMQGLPIYDW